MFTLLLRGKWPMNLWLTRVLNPENIFDFLFRCSGRECMSNTYIPTVEPQKQRK